MTPRSSFSRQSGFTLIEALIGALVVTVLLVGIMFLMSKLFTLTVLKKNLTEINRLGLEGLDRIEFLVRNQPWTTVWPTKVGADKYYNIQLMTLESASDPRIPAVGAEWLVPNTGSGYYRWAQLLPPQAEGVYLSKLTVNDVNNNNVLSQGDEIILTMSAPVANSADVTANLPTAYFTCSNAPDRGFGEGATLSYTNNEFRIILGAPTTEHPLVRWGDTLMPNTQTVVAADTLKHDITLVPGPALAATAVTWYPATLRAEVTVQHVDRGEQFTFSRLLTP